MSTTATRRMRRGATMQAAEKGTGGETMRVRAGAVATGNTVKPSAWYRAHVASSGSKRCAGG
eukprot:5098187-Prymnesium_polylepis.1